MNLILIFCININEIFKKFAFYFKGKTLDRTEHSMKQQSQSASVPRLRSQRVIRPRPKTIHVDDGSVDLSEASSISSRGKKGSNTNLTGMFESFL